MRNLLDAYKPAAPARLHLLLAAALWTVVATLLLIFGARWTLAERMPYAWLVVSAAVAVGLIKARFVLDHIATRMIERIEEHGDGRCVGGFLSLRSWAFVALMVGVGRLLRSGLLPGVVLGLVYLSIGTALLLATRRLWRAWYRRCTGA